MDSFEFNKVLGALLATLFVVFSVSIISDAIFASPAPENPGYAIEAVEEEGAEGEAEPAGPEPIAPLLASADPAAGEAVFKRCASCHTVEEGGANKVGPNLWGIVNRPVASHEGFSYSAAMKEFSQGGSVVWDYENLSQFLLSPKALVPGTAMSFAGLKKAEDRASVIAYLRTLAATPAPLPDPAAAPVEETSQPAEGAAPAEGEPAPAEGAQGAAPSEGEAAPAQQQPAPEGQAQPSAPAAEQGQPAPEGQAAPAEGQETPAAPAEGQDDDAPPSQPPATNEEIAPAPSTTDTPPAPIEETPAPAQ